MSQLNNIHPLTNSAEFSQTLCHERLKFTDTDLIGDAQDKETDRSHHTGVVLYVNFGLYFLIHLLVFPDTSWG